VDASTQNIGVAGVIAMTVILGAGLGAAGVIWLMVMQPASFATLAATDNVWSFLAGLATQLLTII
jgi:hypothetical protein